MPQSPQAPEQRSAPAPHTVLVRPVEGGALVTHLLCAAKPTFVPAMPAAVGGPDELDLGSPGVLMIDLIQAVVAHQCPDGTPEQTTGSLL